MKIDKTLLEIINLCIEIDKKSIKIYDTFSACTELSDDIKSFWIEMANDEKAHLAYWSNLKNLIRRNSLPALEYPYKIKEDLESILLKVDKLSAKSQNICTLSESFKIAFYLEFYMLHRCFMNLLHYVQVSSDKTAVDDYESHLVKFLNTFDRLKPTPELELFVETIKRIWNDNKRLEIESVIDSLTGILNRQGFIKIITSILWLEHRNKNNTGIMMIDIDFFKKINDTYGHLTGDMVLISVADCIKSNIRRSDILGRYGGEEFIVLLPNVTPNNLYDVGEKIRIAVKEGTKDDLPTTVSIGAVQKALQENSKEEMDYIIKKADECLYKAKESGRDRVIVGEV